MYTAFKQYLSTLKLSPVSRKLYLSDVRKFLHWLAGTTMSEVESLTLSQVTPPKMYREYLDSLKSLAAAPSMVKRTTASLKQFGTFLSLTYSLPNPTKSFQLPATNSQLPTHNYLKHFTNYLNAEHLSPLTIKSYKSDITRYLDWASSHLPSNNIAQLLNDKNIKKYLNHLSVEQSTLPSTIERKDKSLTRFQAWYTNIYTLSNLPDSTQKSSLRSADSPAPDTLYSIPNTPYSSPDQSWFSVKKFNYRNAIFLAVLLLFTATLAIFGYRQFSRDVRLTAAYPSTPVTPNRQLSFQGRLENAGGTPITVATNFVFKLFTASSGGTELYSSGTCSITPDSDGVFSTQIGSTCGSGIASSVFTENADVWLEVTVAAETLSPRQQIATVAYALNSETLQGFPLSSTVSAIRNTVVPMNQWGEIIVGEQSPRLKGVSGTFQISAPSLSFITTAGTNGNISFAPDGTGQINATGNTTSTNFFNVSNAQLTTGSLLTGTVANNNTGFKLLDLLSGSSPTSKFSVTDAGTVTLAGDLTVSGTSATLPNNSISPNEILSTSQTDEYCLTYESTGGTWEWQTCGAGGGGSSNWRSSLGALSPLNDTWDLLVGGIATSSAKAGFININSGTPTATVSAGTAGGAFLTATGHLVTTARQSLTLGNSASYDSTGNILLNPNGTGNVGIGVTNPTSKLQIGGTTSTISNSSGDLTIDSFSGNVVFGTDDDLIPTLGAGSADLGSLTLPWDNLFLTNLSFGAAAGTMTLKDNTASAFKIVEGANTYLDITTTDNSETFTLNLPAGGATLHTANLFNANIAQTINLGTGTAVDTINIGTGATSADDINLGGLATSHVDITGITNFAGGTTYFVDASGNAKFLDLQVADTGNPGLTLGDGSTGFAKIGSLTIGDNNASVVTFDANSDATPEFQLYNTGSATASGDIAMGGQLQVGRFAATPTAIGAGVTIFNTTTNTHQCYNGTTWYNCGGTLYSNTNAAVADGSYLTVTHSLATNDLLSSAWIYAQGVWKSLTSSYQPAIAWEGKDTSRGNYHDQVNLYKPSEETNIYTENMLQSGLLFDTFEDTTKTDSANTTASLSQTLGDDGSSNLVTLDQRVQSGRTGLLGGQTYATSTTDNDGQTYLGSNTVNDIYYYDRTRDSVPDVLVELGIDPNWYNGVTLSVATGSAQYSQNGTLADKNPNLTTSYNGSLIKATGTDATPRTIFITIKSPTTFDWTNYQGDAATGVTITPGTAQTLGTTGVSATFTSTNYNVGDVFKIASWYIEAESATRGAKQQFPERSSIIATASSVDIIDADTQKLWIRFDSSTDANDLMGNYAPNNTTILNGKLYKGAGSSAGGLYGVNFASDRGFHYGTSNQQDYPGSISQRNDGLGVGSGYGVAIINATVNDVAAAVIPNAPTQEVTVSGWGYIIGNNTTDISEFVTLPYKFSAAPMLSTTYAGLNASTIPTSLSECNSSHTAGSSITTNSEDVTSNSFYVDFRRSDATTFANTAYYCYTWTSTGTVSPKQFVAVATGATSADGGTTIINETDGTKADVLIGSQYASNAWQNKVFLAKDGTLYTAYNNDTTGGSYLTVYYGVHGLQTETSWAQYYANLYGVGQATSVWPVISGSFATNQINSIYATVGTSTIDGTSNTIYVGTQGGGATVIQETQGHGNSTAAGSEDGRVEKSGSVKYYTKDYISEEMVDDIRGMWPLNNANASSDFEDVSIKANTLTGTNITAGGDSVSGVRGTATDFDGSTEYLSQADDADYDFSTSVSISAWIKTSSTGGYIVRKYQSAVEDKLLRVYTDGKIQFYLHNVMGGTSLFSNKVVTDNQWHFVTATYDGTNAYVYIDGQLDNSKSASGDIADGTGSLYIGQDSAGASYYQGYLDELMITATALTASQIKNMYQVGYRALQSHGTGLGGGAADTNQQLGYISTGTSSVGVVAPDYNNQYMYVGTNSTTLGALSKIQLNSDTNIKTYNSSANVPAGGSLLIDEDITSLGVGYNLETVGSAASGVKSMGVDNNGTATSGNFVSKTYTLPKNIGSAVLWVSPILDASDVSNTLTVKASNDGGSTYATCTLVNTNSNPPVPEKEYACTFTTASNSLKVKFEFARGSTKTNSYVTQYGISWLGETGFRVEQVDTNNTRLYNFSGEAQNLKLNVTGASTAALANPWTDGGSYLYPTGYESLRIYDGAGTNYLGLSHDGTTGNLGLNGTNEVTLTASAMSPSTTDSNALGTSSLMWSDLFLADGGVINFNNGGSTITYTSATDQLDFAASDYNFTTVDGETIDFAGDGTPTVDLIQITGGTTTDVAGTDALSISISSVNGTNQTVNLINGSLTAAGTVAGDIANGLYLDLASQAGGTETAIKIQNTAAWNNDIDFQFEETLSNVTDDLLLFTGVGGTNNTSLTIDLDGAGTTVPTLVGGASNIIAINDSLSIGIDGATTENIAAAGFASSGNDLYVDDMLGVNGAVYIDGAVDMASTMTIAGNLTHSGSASNIVLGSNYLSGDGGDEGIYVDSSGNVGIGDATPATQLEVAGTGTFVVGTTVLTGSIDPIASTTVTGVGTLFLTQLVVGDRITVTGVTKTVTAIASNTSLTVDSAYTDLANDTAPDKLDVGLKSVAYEGANALTLQNAANGGMWNMRLAGDGTSSNNFYLDNTNYGTTNLAIRSTGMVGIGDSTPDYTLDISTTTAGQNALRINSASGGSDYSALIFARGGTNRFNVYVEPSSNNLYFLDADDNQAVIRNDLSALNDDGWATSAIDYGEFMKKQNPQEDIKPFEVVGIKDGLVTKNTNNATMYMITSSDAGIRGGSSLENPRDDDPSWIVVAYTGQVPVLVNQEAKNGDLVIPSGLNDGKAIAVSPDQITSEQYRTVIGLVLNEFDPTVIGNNDGGFETEVQRIIDRKGSNKIANVAVGVRIGGITLDESGDIQLHGTSLADYSVSTNQGLVSRVGAFAQATIAQLTAGLTRTNELEVATISPLAPDQPIAITGPVQISPNSANPDPLLVVDGEIVATTISARLATLENIEAEYITAKNIVADHISANHIEGLDAKIATLSAGLSDSEFDSITDRIKDRLALLTGNTPSAEDVPIPERDPDSIPYTEYSIPYTASDSASLASADIDFATINNYLAVIGQATITDLDITSHLYTASIDSKSGILNLGSNALIVDASGQVMINGDLTVSGSILADSAGFNTLQLGNSPSTMSDEPSTALGQLLAIYDESGVAVATIDASGSANLASLTTGMITIASPAVATQSGLASLLGTAQSNATAGQNLLLSPNTELTIESPYVTPNSLVYLTPTGNTDNKVVFVKSKTSCPSSTIDHQPSTIPCTPSFTVGIDAPANSDISFNWWIIELAPPKELKP